MNIKMIPLYLVIALPVGFIAAIVMILILVRKDEVESEIYKNDEI